MTSRDRRRKLIALNVLSGGAPPVAPTITSSAPANPVYGVAYTHSYTATGTEPITWSVSAGSLPPGLSLNADTGALTGTPTLNGAYSWTVTATNSGGTANQNASVTIALLLPSTNQLAWWNGNAGIYTDTGLTTPAADGEAVAGWMDQSSNGLHVTQGTSGNRPTYRASVSALNNKPAVQFGADDYLFRIVVAGLIANLTAYSSYSVFASTTSGVGYLYAEGNTASTVQFAGARVNTNAAEGAHRSDGNVLANPTGGSTASNGAKHLLTLRRIASNSWAVRLDGVQVGTAAQAPGTTTIDRIALGALIRTTVGSFFTGHLANLANYSSDNFSTIEPLLAAEYGITLP